ncbi:hypothetical protein BACCIP111883_04460 [Sutcliffiella rhizosphaerae]|uniref:DUF4367 domain-containing protein n=2 Tax=Sutcliffiella rhizosphaerae TaxID=2880967 RepID=A0ABM8YUN3_9BACI|nr:hypothetical protein BACCIP111883_04460 [Sutcliffiella rhizosphaerae]
MLDNFPLNVQTNLEGVIIIRIFLTCLLVFTLVSPSTADKIQYYKGSPTLQDVKKIMKFKVFEPTKLDSDWIVSIKYHPDDETTAKGFTMSFLSKKDNEGIMSLSQKKGNGNKPDYEELEKVTINGEVGYFKKWGTDYDHRGKITGGLLWWEQKGTSFEFWSVKCSKECMITFAESLK